MKTLVCCAVVLVVCGAGLAFGGDCCDHCGCQCECNKVCRLVCENQEGSESDVLLRVRRLLRSRSERTLRNVRRLRLQEARVHSDLRLRAHSDETGEARRDQDRADVQVGGGESVSGLRGQVSL